jgi:hypothetical protein
LVQNYYTPTSVRRGVCKNYLYKILRERSLTGTAQRDRSLACHRRSKLSLTVSKEFVVLTLLNLQLALPRAGNWRCHLPGLFTA